MQWHFALTHATNTRTAAVDRRCKSASRIASGANSWLGVCFRHGIHGGSHLEVQHCLEVLMQFAPQVRPPYHASRRSQRRCGHQQAAIVAAAWIGQECSGACSNGAGVMQASSMSFESNEEKRACNTSINNKSNKQHNIFMHGITAPAKHTFGITMQLAAWADWQ